MVLRPIFLTKKEEFFKWLQKVNFLYCFVFIFFVYLGVGLFNPLERYSNVRLIYGPATFLLIFYFYYFFKEKKIKNFVERIGKKSLYFYLIYFIVLHYLFLFIQLVGLYKIPFLMLFSGMTVSGFLISYFFIIIGEKLFNSFSIIKNK